MISLPREQQRSTQLFGEIGRWMGDAAYSVVHFGEQQMSDPVSESRLTERDLGGNQKYYKVK